MTTLRVENLSFAYQTGSPEVLSHVTWSPAPGSFNLLVGQSGSGKPTLLKLMAGLYPNFGGFITSGDVFLNDQQIGPIVPFERAKRVAMLFQNPSRQFAMQTAREELVFTVENLQLPVATIQKRTNSAIEHYSLTSFADQFLNTLSGGELQRVALAIVWAMDADIILLDEPFANVDPAARLRLLADLKTLQLNENKIIIISDHDLSGYDGLIDDMYSLSLDGQLSRSELPARDDTSLALAGPVQSNSAFGWRDLTINIREGALVGDTTLNLPWGQLGLLSGPNGVGKSSLFLALAHQRDYSGQVLFEQLPTERMKQKNWAMKLGLVFQSAADQFVSMTVADEIAMSTKHSLAKTYWTADRIQKALSQLGLADLTARVVYQLSGGQQKKLQTLSMLIMAQPVLLFDEPLAGLDAISADNLLTLMKQTIVDLKLTALMISHQRNRLADVVDYELHLSAEHELTMGGAANA
jgi:energy-coupling factor transport system ATP-binding protein